MNYDSKRILNIEQNDRKIPHCTDHMRKGPTSFHMHDQEFIFKEFDIKAGSVFLDLGCGIGEYSIRAADFVGDSGFVYALDKQKDAVGTLKMNIKRKGLKNVRAVTADIIKPLPIEDNSVDICLISTVLHTLDPEKDGESLFKEIFRVSKHKSRLLTIDCKKEDSDFGPPKHMRISEEELENMVTKYGFKKFKLTDLGHFYMYQFIVNKE